MAIEEICILFDGPPGPEAGRFVEVQDIHGYGIRVGEWAQRSDGYWVLRLEAQVDRIHQPVRGTR